MWTFEQSTGRLYNPDGSYASTGYAGGNEGHNPEGKNNPAMQCVHKIGPLPRGNYTFGVPILQSHLGPFAIPLIPDPSNEMCGRSDFYMHGDTTPSGNASQGCIIMARTQRNACHNSVDQRLIVVADITQVVQTQGASNR